MAGERKGKTYEAIVKVALEELKRQGKLKGEIFWNETPAGMTIEPDFTVGPDRDHPEMVILVTHSGSAKNSDMKFWRNMGELAEAKVRLSKPPRVYSIAFDSVIKEDLKKLQDAAFDGQLIVGDTDYGREVQAWVDENHTRLPKQAEDKALAVREEAGPWAVTRRSTSVFATLTAELGAALGQHRPELDALWHQERARHRGAAPAARTTFVRRGLSKLLIFEDLELALRLYRRKRVGAPEVPEYAYALGLAKKSIAGAVPADSEVLNVAGLLSDQQIRTVLKSCPVAGIAGWLVMLRHAEHLELMGRYVVTHFSELASPDVLLHRLKSLHSDAGALVAAEGLKDWPPRTVWLLDYLIEVVRVASGSGNGYGYAQLALEAAAHRGAPPATDRVYRIVLPDWLHRRGKEDMPEMVLRAMAQALAGRLRAIGESAIAALVLRVPAELGRTLVEAKLVTYRNFEPMWMLLRMTLPDLARVRYPACFAERSDLGGQASKTNVAKSKKTLINWQSAHGSHTNDKKKELCGRAVALRYSWDPRGKRFIPRPGVKKLILVVDGTWRQDDLDALVAAGWDEIYYPDEMDKLAAAIV